MCGKSDLLDIGGKGLRGPALQNNKPKINYSHYNSSKVHLVKVENRMRIIIVVFSLLYQSFDDIASSSINIECINKIHHTYIIHNVLYNIQCNYKMYLCIICIYHVFISNSFFIIYMPNI